MQVPKGLSYMESNFGISIISQKICYFFFRNYFQLDIWRDSSTLYLLNFVSRSRGLVENPLLQFVNSFKSNNVSNSFGIASLIIIFFIIRVSMLYLNCFGLIFRLRTIWFGHWVRRWSFQLIQLVGQFKELVR